MNPHLAPATSMKSLARTLWSHRELIARMTRREITGRYKGSWMGLFWSFLNPLFMLAVYTLVFSVVFKAKWGVDTGGPGSRTQFAIVLFAGMIVHAFFAEVINRAPGLILANTNFVKKVVFPLETLVATTAGAALFHAATSTAVLLLAFGLFNGHLQWTTVFLPLVFLPLIVLAMGCGWFLASVGVFVRDIAQVVAMATAVLMFLSPVFFPVSALPPRLQPWIQLNPLTFIIEQTREVVIWGHLPDWAGLGVYLAIATTVAWLGYAWFQKTRTGFADVL